MKTLAQGDVVVSAGRTIAESDILNFAGLSGDFTPVHIDEEFAKQTPHGTRIAHGPLVTAMAIGMATHSGLFGERVIAAVNNNWTFLAPVKIGDTIRAEVTVSELRPSSKPGRSVATYSFRVLNQNGIEVQTGQLIVVVRAD